jgi:hypothetical protein
MSHEAIALNEQHVLPTHWIVSGFQRGVSHEIVMRGLDPRIHPLRKNFLF